MIERPTEAQARNRWMTIQAARTGGVILAIVGLLVTQGVIAAPTWAGVLVLVVGLAGVFLVPTFLARKWRSGR